MGAASYGAAVKTSFGRARSSDSSAVISLVVEAIERRSSGRLANITSPLRPSTTIADAAPLTSGGGVVWASAPAGVASRSAASAASTRAAALTRAA